MTWRLLLLLLVLGGCAPRGTLVAPRSSPTPPTASPSVSAREAKLVAGARACLGDVYDDSYYAGGPPPRGRGACTDVVWRAAASVGLDLQEAVDRDLRSHPELYGGGSPDRNIDYRRAPNLKVWLSRHARPVARKDLRPGDIVLWSLANDGVADHCGVVSDRVGWLGPLVIHNFAPVCRETEGTDLWPVVGFYRLR